MTFSEQAPQVIIPQFDAFGITLAHPSCSAQTLRRVSSLKRCFTVYIYLELASVKRIGGSCETPAYSFFMSVKTIVQR